LRADLIVCTLFFAQNDIFPSGYAIRNAPGFNRIYIACMQASTQLSLKIKSLYPDPLPDNEAMEAGTRLVSFFKILADVAQQTKKRTNDNFRNQNTADKTK